MTTMPGPEDPARFPFLRGGAVGPTIVGAKNNELLQADGPPILDAGGGAVVTNVGHGRAEVIAAANRSLNELDYVIPVWPTPDRLALVDRLRESWLPPSLTRIGILSGGSESTDSAIRLACAHHEASGRRDRWKIIGRQPSYHGVTVASLSAGGHQVRRAGFESSLLRYPHVPWDDADALEAVIEREDPDTIAAFIVEPIVGAAGGALVPDDDWFPRVAAICRRHDILLIVDEVMTGFGRTGRRLGIELWDVEPDILVGGKGLSGGYAALGGIYATDHVVEPIEESGRAFMFFTYGAQSSACAVASEVLRIMEDENLVERADVMGTLLRARLQEELGDHPHVSDIRGRGLMQGIELVAEREPHTWFERERTMAAKVVGECLDRGVWVYPAGSGEIVQDAILLGPPFTITEDEVDRIASTLRVSIDAAAAS